MVAGSGVSESEAKKRLEAIFVELADWGMRGGRYSEDDLAEHRRRLRERCSHGRPRHTVAR